MLEDLKFVQGAVSKRDFIPAMSHFMIRDKTIRSFNGVFTICSPIDCDIDCNPNAENFIRAITKCKNATQLHLTPAKRLSIKSGNFRALVDTLDTELPDLEPEGDYIPISDGKKLYTTISELFSLIGEDASRPWGTGLLLRGKSCYATNNVILVEKWLGYNIPVEVNIPKIALKEILRVRQYPIGIRLSKSSITFHFENNRWLKTQVLDPKWPDINNLLTIPDNEYSDLTKEFFKALENLDGFTDAFGRVYLNSHHIATADKLDEAKAIVEIDTKDGCGIYNLEMLSKLKTIATRIKWSNYPKPCPFIGDGLRGAIIGLRAEL